MAISLAPDLWLDQKTGGAASPVVSTGVAGTGYVKILSGDGVDGIPGLDLTGSGDSDDSDNAARIVKAIIEQMYQYQESLATADKPTTMVISRSSSSSGANLYTTYSLRFIVAASSAEVADE